MYLENYCLRLERMCLILIAVSLALIKCEFVILLLIITLMLEQCYVPKKIVTNHFHYTCDVTI